MSSPDISFNTIPSTIRKPGTYLEENVSNALQGLQPLGNKVCLLAQKTGSGCAATNTPVKVFSESDLILNFGPGSIAHLAGNAALNTNPNINLTVVGMADGAGAAATGSFGLTGVAGNSGSINFWVGDVIIPVAVNTGDTAVVICNNAKVAIQSVLQELPCTAGVTGTARVELTARNIGTLGNQIALSAKASAGLTGLVLGITGMNGGTVDPDYGAYGTPGTVLASVVGGGYNIYASTLVDATNLGKLSTMINFVSGAMEQRPAVGVFGLTDLVAAYAAVETLCENLNSGRMSAAYLSCASDNLAKSPQFSVGAAYAAALTLNDDPAIPYDGLELDPIAPPSVIDRFTRTQQEDLLHSGVSPLITDTDQKVAIVRAITTYVTNSLGIPDPTLLDITTLRTLDYVREQVRDRLAIVFPRSKLSSRTAAKVKAEVISVLALLESLQIVQNVNKYASGVLVETDLQDPTRLDIKIPTNIVSGLHVIAGVLDLIL